jgi:hypothetical protein
MGSDVSQLGRDDARYVDCARRLTMAMLAGRAVDATLCPSEVARALTAADDAGAPAERWRMFMPHVHAAVDALVAVNRVQLSWKGEALATRAGPYRIGYRSGAGDGGRAGGNAVGDGAD